MEDDGAADAPVLAVCEPPGMLLRPFGAVAGEQAHVQADLAPEFVRPGERVGAVLLAVVNPCPYVLAPGGAAPWFGERGC
jgi:hypothetical protein